MKTSDNRLMVLATILRTSLDSPSFLPGRDSDTIRDVADELEALAQLPVSDNSGEGPSDGEMLEWVCENVSEFRKVRGKVRVTWIAEGLQTRSKYGTDWRDAIRRAMAEDAAGERAGVTT
jgi:hypothetical protein